MVVSDLHRSLGLESRAPHTPLATDATKKRFYRSVCPLRSHRLQIRDDGAGFDPGKSGSSERGGFGLSGMEERAKAVHGKLEVESRPGQGTQITLSTPYV